MPRFYCKSCRPHYHTDWSFHLQNPTLECSGLINKDYRCYRLPFYDAINYRAPDAVILTLLKTSNDDALAPDIRDQCYPMEMGIQLKHSDRIILALLAADKEIAKRCFSDGSLPLHKVLELKYSNEIILAVLEVNKDAVTKCDRANALPLHKAIQSQSSEDIVLKLYQEHEIASTKMCNGWLPLHLALSYKYSDTIILALFNACKQTSSFFIY
jgi:hypothetical protein